MDNFKRGISPRKSLELGLEGNPRIALKYLRTELERIKGLSIHGTDFNFPDQPSYSSTFFYYFCLRFHLNDERWFLFYYPDGEVKMESPSTEITQKTETIIQTFLYHLRLEAVNKLKSSVEILKQIEPIFDDYKDEVQESEIESEIKEALRFFY